MVTKIAASPSNPASSKGHLIAYLRSARRRHLLVSPLKTSPSYSCLLLFRDPFSALPPSDAGGLEESPVVERRMIWDQMLVAATGSADTAAYIFDAGGSRGEQGEFIQKLDGHKNRVYSAMFHPTQVFQPPGCCLGLQFAYCE